jgi:hypothetical protein
MTKNQASAPRVSRAGRVWIPRSAPLLAGNRIQYHVYGNTGIGDPINYATPLATVDALTWSSSSLAASGTWKFGVRAFDAVTGLEEENLDCAVKIVLDASGSDVTNRPLSPTGLRAFAVKGGAIKVEWYYPQAQGPGQPTGFHVYVTAGATLSYATPAATVPYSAGLMNVFQAVIPGLIGGVGYVLACRAYNGSGEETNIVTVPVTAVTMGPSAVLDLTAIPVV